MARRKVMAVRDTTAKPAGPRTQRRGVVQTGGEGVCRSGVRVIVTAEQCECLIEGIANFRAARYRPIEPGQYRKQDRRVAETEIKAVLKQRRKPA